MHKTPLTGGITLSEERGYQLIYYKSGQFAGHVIGWTQEFEDGKPLDQWRTTDFGTPFDAIKSYPGLRKKLLQAAAGEL